ncbi:MAG: serpin family protein [Bacteroidales bacterium]|nr:serpin family protein [Bacteroidales bacterium]
METLYKLIIPAAALLVSAAACASSPDVPADGNEWKPLSLSTRQKEIVNLGQTFSFEFIDRIEAESATEDYVVSPLSMQILLGMILNGAQGGTADEISTVLGYGQGAVQEVNEFCKAMLLQLPELDRKTTLKIADAIVVDKGFELLPSYNKVVKEYYGANISNLDFNDTKGSADIINQWCSDHTNGLIPQILDEVSPTMLCYLLNALYFKGEWTNKFNAKITSDQPFYRDGMKVKEVPLMSQYHNFDYAESELFQAVKLPYGNGAFSMTILLPKGKHSTGEITKFLKANDWRDLMRRMYDCKVDLFIPKFETRYHKQLNEILSKMGMPTSFLNGADFSKMSPDALKLSFVQQDAMIKVDEEGAEAAAISSAGMEKTTAIPEDPVLFRADHPFVYVISESSSGAILFAGRYSAL